MGSEFKSNTTLEHKDRWQTPVEIFDALDLEFGFYLDAAADHDNALCSRYLTEHDDALNSDWLSHGAIWVNPPYSDIMPWVRKAEEQCQRQSQTIVMLIPSDISTQWFSTALKTADEVRFVVDGRIQFINSGTGLPGKNGAGKGNVFFIWRPFTAPRRIFTTVSRDHLIEIGKKVRAA